MQSCSVLGVWFGAADKFMDTFELPGRRLLAKSPFALRMFKVLPLFLSGQAEMEAAVFFLSSPRLLQAARLLGGVSVEKMFSFRVFPATALPQPTIESGC